MNCKFAKFYYLFLQPLYNCPWDNEIYHENIRHYQSFKSRLIESLKQKRMERDVRDNAVAQKYRDLASAWQDNVEKMENSVRRRSKDAKYRETFEKVFPELRKQREDKERFSRCVTSHNHSNTFKHFIYLFFLGIFLQGWCSYQKRR